MVWNPCDIAYCTVSTGPHIRLGQWDPERNLNLKSKFCASCTFQEINWTEQGFATLIRDGVIWVCFNQLLKPRFSKMAAHTNASLFRMTVKYGICSLWPYQQLLYTSLTFKKII